VVYDVGSGAAVSRFAEPGNDIGLGAAVAPAGDAVAVGGNPSKVVPLRELAPPAPPPHWARTGAGTGGARAGAAAGGDVGARASDPH
jgi:hypothetical protein